MPHEGLTRPNISSMVLLRKLGTNGIFFVCIQSHAQSNVWVWYTYGCLSYEEKENFSFSIGKKETQSFSWRSKRVSLKVIMRNLLMIYSNREAFFQELSIFYFLFPFSFSFTTSFSCQYLEFFDPLKSSMYITNITQLFQRSMCLLVFFLCLKRVLSWDINLLSVVWYCCNSYSLKLFVCWNYKKFMI